jgi:aldehyde:ferredoxin oxidoreductase
MFNIREGIRRKDDNLPVRYLKEPITKGPTKGKVFMGIESMLDRYYDLRGWEKKTGIPTKEKLGELGILQIVENKRGV